MNIFEEIINFLRQNLVKYEILNHEPVYTSEEAARIRGLSMSMGAKSLLLKADEQFVLVILPGDKKINSKKLKNILVATSLSFATPDEVKEKMFCEIGACYPFGNLINIKMLVDQSLGENEMISFNPGVHNKSIKIEWSDYIKAVNPELADFS